MGCRIFSLLFVLFVMGGVVQAAQLEEIIDDFDRIEISQEDLALVEGITLPKNRQHEASVAEGEEHITTEITAASSSGRVDLTKLWDMLTEGMNVDEKKLYAKEFLGVVQRYQEREAVQEHREIITLLLKTAVVLAAVGVVVYVIYAIIAASKQETERVALRARTEKAVAKANASHVGFDKEMTAAKAANGEMRDQLRRDVADVRELLRRDMGDMRDQVRRDADLSYERAMREIALSKDQAVLCMQECVGKTRALYEHVQQEATRNNAWNKFWDGVCNTQLQVRQR